MTLEGQDAEAAIIQKLDNLIDFVESFKSSLEEPPEKKGREIPVTVELLDDGKIINWYPNNLDYVTVDQRLCEIRWGSIGLISGTTMVTARAQGYLHILAREGTNIPGGRIVTIAYIDTSVIV